MLAIQQFVRYSVTTDNDECRFCTRTEMKFQNLLAKSLFSFNWTLKVRNLVSCSMYFWQLVEWMLEKYIEPIHKVEWQTVKKKWKLIGHGPIAYIRMAYVHECATERGFSFWDKETLKPVTQTPFRSFGVPFRLHVLYPTIQFRRFSDYHEWKQRPKSCNQKMTKRKKSWKKCVYSSKMKQSRNEKRKLVHEFHAESVWNSCCVCLCISFFIPRVCLVLVQQSSQICSWLLYHINSINSEVNGWTPTNSITAT